MAATPNTEVDSKEVENALSMWRSFTKLIKWSSVAIAVVLLLLLLLFY